GGGVRRRQVEHPAIQRLGLGRPASEQLDVAQVERGGVALRSQGVGDPVVRGRLAVAAQEELREAEIRDDVETGVVTGHAGVKLGGPLQAPRFELETGEKVLTAEVSVDPPQQVL